MSVRGFSFVAPCFLSLSHHALSKAAFTKAEFEKVNTFWQVFHIESKLRLIRPFCYISHFVGHIALLAAKKPLAVDSQTIVDNRTIGRAKGTKVFSIGRKSNSALIGTFNFTERKRPRKSLFKISIDHHRRNRRAIGDVPKLAIVSCRDLVCSALRR